MSKTELVMRTLTILITLLPSLASAQPLPQQRPMQGGSCPHGYSASGSFCVPREGAQEAVPATAEWDVSVELDKERKFLPAQRRTVTWRSSAGVCTVVTGMLFCARSKRQNAFGLHRLMMSDEVNKKNRAKR